MKIIVGRILFGLAFAAAGLWMARICVLAVRRRAEWRREGVVVEGEVVAFEERADTNPSELRKLFAPIVTFRTAEGAPMRFTSGTAARPNPYTVGQKVAVRYLRQTPAEADLDSATTSFMTIAVTAVMAVVFLGVSLLPVFLPMPGH